MTEPPSVSDESTLEAQARRRAEAKLDWIKHLLTYAVVIGTLAVINLLTSPGYLWFLWPAAGWGIALIAHAVNAFVPSAELLRRLTERELKRGRP